MAARRMPYAHNQEPLEDAPPSSDDKLWEQAPIQPQEQPLEINLADEDPPVIQKPDPIQEPVVAQPDPEPEPAREPPKPSADDLAFERLKAQLDRERQAREAAHKRAEQLQAEQLAAQERLREEQERSQAVQREHLEAQAIAIDNAISFAESQAAAAQQAINRGLSEGDYEASTNAYRVLAKAESDLARLKEGKDAIEAQKKAPVTRQEPAPQQAQPQQPQTTWERIEAYITQPAHSPRAQQYMRDHYDDLFADFDGGAQRLHKLLGGHYLAKGDGVIENSDSYFDYLDRHMGYKEAPKIPEPIATPPAAPKKAVPPAAPVSRSSQNGSGNSATSITLTPVQVQTAKELGIEPREYAKYLLKIRNGKDDPNYSGPRFSTDLM